MSPFCVFCTYTVQFIDAFVCLFLLLLSLLKHFLNFIRLPHQGAGIKTKHFSHITDLLEFQVTIILLRILVDQNLGRHMRRRLNGNVETLAKFFKLILTLFRSLKCQPIQFFLLRCESDHLLLILFFLHFLLSYQVDQ